MLIFGNSDMSDKAAFLLSLLDRQIGYFDIRIDGYYYGICENNILFINSTVPIKCENSNVLASNKRGFYMVTSIELNNILKLKPMFFKNVFRIATIDNKNNILFPENEYYSLFVKRINLNG